MAVAARVGTVVVAELDTQLPASAITIYAITIPWWLNSILSSLPWLGRYCSSSVGEVLQHGHVCIHAHRHACTDVCEDMCLLMCTNRCIGKCVGICIDMCMDACVAMCMDVYRHVCRHVPS